MAACVLGVLIVNSQVIHGCMCVRGSIDFVSLWLDFRTFLTLWYFFVFSFDSIVYLYFFQVYVNVLHDVWLVLWSFYVQIYMVYSSITVFLYRVDITCPRLLCWRVNTECLEDQSQISPDLEFTSKRNARTMPHFGWRRKWEMVRM